MSPQQTPPSPTPRTGAGGTEPTQGLPPLNQIVQQITEAYLRHVDPSDPPPAHVVEQELIHLVNSEIEMSNSMRPVRTSHLSYLRTLTFSQVAQVMLHVHHICRIAPAGKNTDPDYDLLALYAEDGPDQGIYLTSEEAFRQVARSYNYSMSHLEFREVMTVLKDAAPRRFRTMDRDLIPVANGVFDYATKQLRPFSPELVFVAKSHVPYVAGPTNPVITNPDGSTWDVETWIAELFDDPELSELIWEILGAIIRPGVRWNKSAWFFSERGNNGKGTLCELMRNLCGPTAYASVPLADFSKEFQLEPIMRANAIIVDENDVGTYIDKAANLKAVVTNDVISINRKFKAPVAFQFFGFMVQCLNEYPRVKDRSESFYRRQLFVPFTKSFTGAERRYIKDDYLHRPEVLQYVLHRVLHMNYYVLSEPAATREVLEDYKSMNDPVRAFFEEFSEQFTWDLVPFAFLYDLYRSWFARTNPAGSPLGLKTFSSDLRQIVEGSGRWYATAPGARVRPANRMDNFEPLVLEYDLRSWMDPDYSGNDPRSRARPVLKTFYQGLCRYGSGPAALAPETDPQNQDAELESDLLDAFSVNDEG